MAEVSYINPLSNEGRQIIRQYGDLNQIFDEDESLIDIIIHTNNQKISDDSLIPKSYADYAMKRIQWAIEKKNNKNYTQSEFEYLTNSDLFEQDVVVFHILCQAIAIQFNLGSRETRLYVESLGTLILERLAKIPPMARDEIIDEAIEYATIYKNNFNIDVLDNGLSATPSFKRISALMYATRSMTMVPYCLYILKNVTDIAEQQKIFDYLEKYMMRRFVCGSKNNNYSDFFSENMIGQSIDSFTKLKDYIEAKPYSDNLAMPTDADIDNAVANLSASQNTQIILYMLESKLNSLAATGYSSGYNNYILDNVMPVKDCPNWPLNGQTQEERKTLATNLGNVILIHKDKGLASKVKTESFNNKKKIIEDDIKEVVVSKNILNPQVWTENMILTRANWLAEKIKNVWRV